jgi:hypothetical protein
MRYWVTAAIAGCALGGCVDADDTSGLRRGLTWDLPVPADQDLLAQSAAALEKKRRAELDQALDASEPGELLEHATLPQNGIDSGNFDLADMFRFADDLFEYSFRPENGSGNGLSPGPGVPAGSADAPNLRRVHQGDFGGPDALACVDCHSLGGPDGAGTQTQVAFFRSDGNRTLSADRRNAPHLLGLGPVQALATEMSQLLAAARDAAIASAMAGGSAVTAPLGAKGISFGSITANPDGTVDTSAVEGVDSDLVIRPFGWKGHQASLRGAIKEAFRIHLGVVAASDQELIRRGELSAALFGDGIWYDVDADGVSVELEDGMLSTMVAYLAQLEVPLIRPPSDPVLLQRFGAGRAAFDRALCGDCHRPELILTSPLISTYPEHPDFADRLPVIIDVAHDGDFPKIQRTDQTETRFHVRLFSDLRRHDLGPELAAPMAQGSIAASVWLTRPLWGLAETAPYLHDGRAPTVDDAIRLHGGDAAASRDVYLALGDDDQRSLAVFLLSLTRQPKLLVP